MPLFVIVMFLAVRGVTRRCTCPGRPRSAAIGRRHRAGTMIDAVAGGSRAPGRPRGRPCVTLDLQRSQRATLETSSVAWDDPPLCGRNSATDRARALRWRRGSIRNRCCDHEVGVRDRRLAEETVAVPVGTTKVCGLLAVRAPAGRSRRVRAYRDRRMGHTRAAQRDGAAVARRVVADADRLREVVSAVGLKVAVMCRSAAGVVVLPGTQVVMQVNEPP